ncbi:hypothetical protein D7V80_34845 [Corallococcus sp. CA054B]|uniref:hypothetical protein n=1 Tax=Corallococcus sp. CA054B TaxID=2316734 RepID=UPI000EA17B6A|nr:hypothetical protein [Corallococcus sp. CA054B]RKG61368.1 hypothetical protein D7V80_34845 [Corallococcus sp. CA054B]
MTRSDQRRGHAWGVLFLGLAVAWASGCKKEQPVDSAPVDAGGVAVAAVDAGVPDAGTVAKAKVVKPLRFSDVVIARQDLRVDVTYTLSNPGTAQARGDACMTLLDAEGTVIRTETLGGITVKGETTDTFEDKVYADAPLKLSRTVLLYTTAAHHCSDGVDKATSEPLRLLLTGQPAPADAPAPRKEVPSKPEDFELTDVEVGQVDVYDDYYVNYTVKNVSGRRVSGKACLRGYGGSGKDLEDIVDADTVGEFHLEPGARETVDTARVHFADSKHWDEVTVLRLFVSADGCGAGYEAARGGFRFEKPGAVGAPDDSALEGEHEENEAARRLYDREYEPRSDSDSEETAD